MKCHILHMNSQKTVHQGLPQYMLIIPLALCSVNRMLAFPQYSYIETLISNQIIIREWPLGSSLSHYFIVSCCDL